jgi:hypothetical protein
MKLFLKTILPATWVASLASLANKLNRFILAPIAFKQYPHKKITFLHYKEECPSNLIFKNPSIAYQNLPTKIKESFISFNKVKQQEFIASVSECFIEPKYGWPMTKSRELIYDCFPYSRQSIVPLPPLFGYNKSAQSFDKIISFREIFDFGYWHFYTDILHKTYLLDECDEIERTVPVLISRELFSKEFFKFFYERTDFFKGRKLIVQDHFLVHARTAYFVKPMPHRPSHYLTTSEKVKAWKGDPQLKRRIFLTRAPQRGRTIANLHELKDTLVKNDIELIDADILNIEQQIKLFSETELLVGIHGAGLTNLMFRSEKKMKVLEIFPDCSGEYQIPPHYFLLSNIFGFKYRALLGSAYKSSLKKTFVVDPLKFEAALKELDLNVETTGTLK